MDTGVQSPDSGWWRFVRKMAIADTVIELDNISFGVRGESDIRAKPDSIVLFDEIEKAYPRLLDSLREQGISLSARLSSDTSNRFQNFRSR